MATFGYTTSDGDLKGIAGGAGGALVVLAALSEAGSVSKLSAYIENAGGPANHAVGFIKDYSGGEPSTTLGVTTETAIGAYAATTWYDFTFATPLDLSAGNYFLGVQGQTGGSNMYNVATGTNYVRGGAGTYPTPGACTDWPGGFDLRVYATYDPPAPPALTTAAITAITAATASGGGTITDEGGSAVTAKGVCWNTTGAPTIADSHTTD
jgi:hypothetical protein